MKKTISVLLAAFVLIAPAPMAAQSSEDIALQLLNALDPVVPSKAPSATSSAPQRAMSSATPTPAIPDDAKLPLQLFSIDSNAQKQSKEVEDLKALLASLTVQLVNLMQRSSATSTPAAAQPAAKPPTFARNLDIGSRGDDVTMLQEMLIEQKYLPGEPTGYFGALTKEAVRLLQIDHALEPVGTVGPKTRAVLNSLAENPAPSKPDTATQEIPTDIIVGTPLVAIPDATTTPDVFDIGTSTDAALVSLTAFPDTVESGESVQLSWETKNAVSCEAFDAWSGPQPKKGTAIYSPVEYSLNFVLTCTNAAGADSSDFATVTVRE